jgi:hypothetical protein|tara:strand:- start:14639 stop:15931 length:1293 start_codon:yes stop_codon:yes gene_type:complete
MLLLITTSVIIVALYAELTKERLRVCYTVESEKRSTTQLFWSGGEGFSEENSAKKHLRPGRPNKICHTGKPITDHGLIRIDPIGYNGAFVIGNITIDREWSLLPFLFDIQLSTSAAMNSHHVRTLNGQKYSTSGDPYFIWKFDARMRKGEIYAVNSLVFFLALAGIVIFSIKMNNSRELSAKEVASVLVALLYFFGFALIAWLAEEFQDLMSYLRLVLLWSLLLALLSIWLQSKKRIKRYSTPALVVLSLLVTIIYFDLVYRLAWVDRPLFAINSHNPYNWTIDRSATENYKNSSVRYYGDFSKIRSLIIPGSFFISDVATSYYISAALPLFPTIVHPHHSIGEERYVEFLSVLCSHSVGNDLVNKYSVILEEKVYPLPKYVIVIKDSENRNVNKHCTNLNHQVLLNNIELVANPLFKGKFTSVYSLKKI